MSLIIALILILFGSVLRAFVVKTLWAWFVVEYFHVAPLSMALAYGLSLLIATATTSVISYSRDEDDKSLLMTVLTSSLVEPTIALLLGGFAHLFI